MNQKDRAGGHGLCLLFAGLEGILQTDGAVEHQMTGSAVLGVGAEVAQTHELIGSGGLGFCQGSLHLAAGENLQGIGVQTGQVNGCKIK